ncbi:ATP-binding cassette domain-containing protein [Ktedonosporobacter rubrisoli]|uniref:ATP-binding cassette domain-containing protein n=1 Tax=Ktedonosporobacter rubrisoli TaxID=2509675 RepID=A0A4P6K022_KTERU|nr:ATP-binding cassette domain-containing protein [Ktedonosporobacter rubrisoli]QBD80960.1 ATP-binding cassette domain-containing protein [Ktedonosporobacter rubrisoli]
MNIAIHIDHVSKDFGLEHVLHDICHDFEEGKIHGIVGNNGSGKTVLMKCICGFQLPTKGKVFVHNKQIGKDVDFPESLGLIIETPGFLPGLTGKKNLQILASLRGKIRDASICEALKLVGLDPKLKKTVNKYSLGMRQRLGIAQAIMEDPCLLVLDEPFNGLDKQGVLQMRELILSLRDQGKTILLASHNAQDIEVLCDTVCEMDAGVLTQLPRATANSSAPDLPLASVEGGFRPDH